MEPDDKTPPGISLEELPDAAPAGDAEAAIQEKLAALRARRALETELRADPRGPRLKHLSDEQKLLAMTRRYQFGRKEIAWGLVALYALPVLLKHLQAIPRLVPLFQTGDAFNVLGGVVVGALGNLQALLGYAELIVAGLVVVKPPLRWRRDYFVVTFDGLELPRAVRLRAAQPEERVTVRWADVARVELREDAGVSFLELRRGSGELVGHLLWNLSHNERKLFYQLLCQMVPEQHPLRLWAEQERG